MRFAVVKSRFAVANHRENFLTLKNKESKLHTLSCRVKCDEPASFSGKIFNRLKGFFALNPLREDFL
jgi:hypothetical protein